MLTNRATLLLVISLILSAVAIWSARRWLEHQVEVRTSANQARIVVATTPLNPGERILANQVRIASWPAPSVAPGAFGDPGVVAGRVVLRPVTTGEPVLEGMLAPAGSRSGLAVTLPAGQRAVTIRVNEVGGVAGFALPGNYVDVVATLQDETSRMISRLVLQHVLVLAIAQEAAVKDEVKAKVVNSVTLQVTPQEAERLDLAQGVGTLALALRNPTDAGTVTSSGTHKSELLGQAPGEGYGQAMVASPAGLASRVPASRGPLAPIGGSADHFANGVEVVRGTLAESVLPR